MTRLRLGERVGTATLTLLLGATVTGVTTCDEVGMTTGSLFGVLTVFSGIYMKQHKLKLVHFRFGDIQSARQVTWSRQGKVGLYPGNL